MNCAHGRPFQCTAGKAYIHLDVFKSWPSSGSLSGAAAVSQVDVDGNVVNGSPMYTSSNHVPGSCNDLRALWETSKINNFRSIS